MAGRGATRGRGEKEKRKEEGREKGKKVERVIRASVDRSFFHLRILISRWKKRERANETIPREREESGVIQFTKCLSLSFFFSLFLDLCLGQRSSPLVSSSKNGARTTSPTGCPVPFLHHRSSTRGLEKVRAEWRRSLAVSRVGRLYLLDLTRFFDNQGATVEKFEKDIWRYLSSLLRVAVFCSVFSLRWIISYLGEMRRLDMKWLIGAL